MNWFIYLSDICYERVNEQLRIGWQLLKICLNLGIIHLVRKQIFRETNISYPLIRTSTCAYQGVRNVSFSENFAYVLNEWSLKAMQGLKIA